MTKKKASAKRKELRKSLENFVKSANLAKTMNECLWVGDKNHKTLYVNPMFEKLSEYSLEECIDQNCVTWFDEKGKRTISEHHKIRTKGQSSQYEANMVSKSGKIVPLLISGAPTKTGGTIGVFTNLTKIKKYYEQQELLEQIIRNSTEAIVVLDKSHNIKMWNMGAEKIFGYKEKEVRNKSLGKIIIPHSLETENQKLIEEVERKKFVYNFETKRLTKNGDKIDVSLSITKVINNRKLIGYLVVYQDITRRKRVNTELQKRFEAIQDAYKELGIQTRQADYMNEIIEIAVSSEKIEKVGKLIVSASCMLTKCDGAVLRLIDPKKKTMHLLTSLGVDHKWRSKSKTAFQNSLAEDAYKTGRPIIIQDLSASHKHQSIRLIKTHSFKTMILLPLIVDKIFIGTLSLYVTDPGKFRFIETVFLERFGKLCSLAICIKKYK